MATRADSSAATLWAMAHLGTPMAIRVAATLGIADRLAGGPRTAAELAPELAANPDALDRLLRYLAVRGVFARDSAGRFQLNELARPLLDDHPSGMRRGMDIDSVGRTELSFFELLHTVRTGEAGYLKQHGRTFWQDLATDPYRRESFTRWMGSDAPARSPELLAACDWGSVGHLVDVGGGNGSLTVALLRHFPALRATVLDLPETVQDARAALAEARLVERADTIGGSFFDPLPAGAGGYLLSWILHDWDDQHAVAILRRCAQAVAPSGLVFVVEKVGADGESPHTGMDLRMLALYGGKERGVSQLTALAAAAGLALTAVHPAGAFSVLAYRLS